MERYLFDELGCQAFMQLLPVPLLHALYQHCHVEWTTLTTGVCSITARERDSWRHLQQQWYATVPWPLRRFWGKMSARRNPFLRSETGDSLRGTTAGITTDTIDSCAVFTSRARGHTSSRLGYQPTGPEHARSAF